MSAFLVKIKAESQLFIFLTKFYKFKPIEGHGDSQPFDGKGGSVGHADPTNYNIHFDSDEDWSTLSKEMFFWLHPNKGTDFIQGAVHEIGHVLRLSHDND